MGQEDIDPALLEQMDEEALMDYMYGNPEYGDEMDPNMYDNQWYDNADLDQRAWDQNMGMLDDPNAMEQPMMQGQHMMQGQMMGGYPDEY